jgi:hypothetical protein
MWIRERGWVRLILRLAYASLPLQIVVTVLVLSFSRVHRRNRELLLAATLALLVTSVGYAWLPALGPFVTVPVPGTLPGDTVYVPHVEALRGPGPHRVDVVDLQGIVVLPSYHTVLGVLFVWAHRGLRWSFPVFLLLNLLMLASVPSEGGHYLVDLLAGLAVAVIAIAAARRLTNDGFGIQSRDTAPDVAVSRWGVFLGTRAYERAERGTIKERPAHVDVPPPEAHRSLLGCADAAPPAPLASADQNLPNGPRSGRARTIAAMASTLMPKWVAKEIVKLGSKTGLR